MLYFDCRTETAWNQCFPSFLGQWYHVSLRPPGDSEKQSLYTWCHCSNDHIEWNWGLHNSVRIALANGGLKATMGGLWTSSSSSLKTLFPYNNPIINLLLYITTGLWWVCCNETAFLSIVKMSFTEPLWLVALTHKLNCSYIAHLISIIWSLVLTWSASVIDCYLPSLQIPDFTLY